MGLLANIIAFALQPELKNYEDLGLKSFLASLCIALMFAIWKLYQSKETKLKEQRDRHKEVIDAKDTQINELQKQRLDDFKLYSAKYQEMAEKQFNHFQQSTEFFKSLRDGNK